MGVASDYVVAEMKCKDCLHFGPWVTDYVGKDKKPFRHMLGNFGERGDKGKCDPGYGKSIFIFGEDSACENYEPKEGD